MAFSKWKTTRFLGVHVHTAITCLGKFVSTWGPSADLKWIFLPVEKMYIYIYQTLHKVQKKRTPHFFWISPCGTWLHPAIDDLCDLGKLKSLKIPKYHLLHLPRRPTRILGKLSWWFGNKARNQEQVHPWSSWFGVGKGIQQQTSTIVVCVSGGRCLPTLYHIYMLHSCGWECKRVGYWFLILWVYSRGHSCFKIQTKLISVFFPNSVYGGCSGWALTFQFIITRAIYRMQEPSQIHSVPRPQGCSCLSVVFFLESDSDRGYIFMHLCIHIYIYCIYIHTYIYDIVYTEVSWSWSFMHCHFINVLW